MSGKFILKIEFADALKASPEDHTPDYDFKADDVNSLLRDICEILHNQDIGFVVSGFGQDWPVDVNTDLLVILEQINDCLKEIDFAKFDFCLDFYEQGIERRLNFSDHNADTVKVICESDTDWEPNPSEILIDKHSIAMMLNKLKSDFILSARTVCPKLSCHAWFDNWARQSNQH